MNHIFCSKCVLKKNWYVVLNWSNIDNLHFIISNSFLDVSLNETKTKLLQITKVCKIDGA